MSKPKVVIFTRQQRNAVVRTAKQEPRKYISLPDGILRLIIKLEIVKGHGQEFSQIDIAPSGATSQTYAGEGAEPYTDVPFEKPEPFLDE